MSHYDVFNGDADGICALHQLRLAEPHAGTLVTGTKRDIALLARVDAGAGDSVTVLDVSMARNRPALDALLAHGAIVQYFDHHDAGEPLRHPNLQACIDTSPGACTSALVDRCLAGRHRHWAIVGAFGDNLPAAAESLARGSGLDAAAFASLRGLGEAMNYNAYGDSETDLLVPPARLYEMVRPYADPLDFVARESIVADLVARQRGDLALADAVAPSAVLPGGRVYLLPDAPWARRVQGAFANMLSLRTPQAAIAVLRPAAAGQLMASVRSPQREPWGADTLCRSFPGGGGRAAAGGIDRLPRARLQEFVAAFANAYPGA